MFIGRYGLPAIRGLDSGDAVEIDDLRELLFSAEVVPDVVEADLAYILGRRVLHQEGDGDRGAASTAEDLAALSARQLARGALVPSQVEDMDGGELLG